MKKLVRIVLLLAGTLCMALGILGIILPLVPTTPFLLLAAYCYARSSERFYQWLLSNRFFGAYIRNYREGRGMPLREKILTLAVLWVTIGIAVLFAVPVWWGKLIMLGIAAGVTLYLLQLKTYRPQTENKKPAPEPGDSPGEYDATPT